MAQHSVWGASAPPGTYTWNTDGTPSIWTAMGFYRTAFGTPVGAVVGARLWVTGGALAANTTASIRVFLGGDADAGMAAAETGFESPIETKVMNITETGWNEVMFDNPIPTDVAERVYVAVQYGGNDDGYQYGGALGSGSAILAENGMAFALGSAGDQRAVFKIGAGTMGGAGGNGLYGLDIIFDDGAPGDDTTPPSVPTGLNITAITHNSATASWTASTDDVGVTGYQVYKDGVSAGTPAGTSINLTGLTPETAYDITVRARDAAGNWSAQTSSVSFTTGAGPTEGGRWINHVAIVAAGNGTTSHTAGPNAGNVVSGELFTPTAGNLLLCIAEGAVTSTTPSGWTLPAQGAAVNNTGLYVWWREAVGGDSLTTTHNAANYPEIFDFYEFGAGSSFFGTGSAATGVDNGVAAAALTGLTGLNLVMFAMARGIGSTSGTSTVTWGTGEEIVDHLQLGPGGSIDGFQYSLAILEDYTGSSASSTAEHSPGVSGSTNHERLTFAIHVVNPAGGDTEAPSVPTGVEVTPSSISATIEWTASTDDTGVTGYQVFIDGSPVGTPSTTLYHATGLTPSTTYEVTVRARDAAANWSAQTSPVEFTTLAVTKLTIAEENSLAGTDRAFWLDIGGAAGDTSNVGYAKTFSNEVGTTVEFACHGGGSVLQIYRLGWYGGAGARHVDTVEVTPTTQGAGATIPSSNNGITFAGWTVNAEWEIPAVATSGFYLGLYRNAADNNASWIPFVVKDSARDSDMVYKTSDATWMIAYGHYGGPGAVLDGASFYGSAGGMGGGGITSRAHACTYDRPYVTRAGVPLTAWSNAELPMIRWIERMGVEVKYIGCMDLHDSVDCLDGAAVFMSNGHDEYWSTEMRDNVEAFRDAGGHLIFASGNEVFWRIRRDTTDPNIIWCFKDTMPGPGGHTAGVPLDPVSWTGTWKDTRWGSRRPENLTTGTDFRMNAMSSKTTTFSQAAAYADHPVWRNSALAGGADQAVLGIVGFEADDMMPALTGSRVVTLASETYNIDDNRADDNGQNYNGDGNLNWGVVSQRYPSGAVVIGFGTVQWSWGLDTMHDATNTSGAANLSMQQMTYNLLRDLGANSATPHTGVVTSTPVSLDAYGVGLTTSTKSVDVAWVAQQQLTRNVFSTWVAAQRGTKNVSAAWVTRFTGLKQFTAAWVARSRGTTAVSSAWVALQRLTKNVPVGWSAVGVTYTATKDVDSAWATRVSGTKAVSSSWAARAQLVKFVATGWVSEGITYTLTRTVDSGWSVRVRVTGTAATAGWSTRSRLVKNVISRWITYSDVPVGNDEPVAITLSRRPGGRAYRSITIRRRR